MTIKQSSINSAIFVIITAVVGMMIFYYINKGNKVGEDMYDVQKEILSISKDVGTVQLSIDKLTTLLEEQKNLSLANQEEINVLKVQITELINNTHNKREILEGVIIESFPAVKYDSNGKVFLEIEIDILSEQFRWKCASIDEVVRGNKEIDLGEVIRSYNQELDNVDAVVCIGTASSEGGTFDEEQRSKDRVETLINIVSNNLESKKLPIFGLNFGKYDEQTEGSCSDATIEQRRVVLLKVIKKSDQINEDNFEEQLVEILIQKAKNKNINFPIDLRNYTMYRNKKTMLIAGRNYY